ncbi:MAG: MazG nucleotide pyrophosphohydrolase domain-containing protein [Acidimicrobiales bacterium]
MSGSASGSTKPTEPRVTICGLGPGDPGLATEATAELLAGPARVFLRTSRHPGAERVVDATSFDHVYERADTFDEVYRTITDEVLAAASEEGHVVYAVPGSPLVLERSVRHLRSAAGVAVRLLPAVSFLDEVWARLQVDPIDDGVRLVDGLRFATDAADQRGPVLVAHAHADWVLSDIKLALDVGPEQRVIVLQRLGTDDERVFEVGWPDLDRLVDADHLTSLYIPELAAPVGYELTRSVEMMGRLRNECPWDRQQTHRSLRKYLIEEAYEVLDAIDGLPGEDAGYDAEQETGDDAAETDGYVDLEEELGDLWFQILFHSELATEAGQFTIADVARGLTDKMIRRHPHVYRDRADDHGPPLDSSIPADWEQLKQREKQRGSALDGIPPSLPALSLAEKTLKKGDGAGAEIELGSLEELIAPLVPEGASTDQVGAALLAMVELGRRQGINAEQALREATKRAAVRFRTAEATGAGDRRWVLG